MITRTDQEPRTVSGQPTYRVAVDDLKPGMRIVTATLCRIVTAKTEHPCPGYLAVKLTDAVASPGRAPVPTLVSPVRSYVDVLATPQTTALFGCQKPADPSFVVGEPTPTNAPTEV